MPIELLAGVVSSFPGSTAWVNLPQIGDDSIYTTMAQKIAANIGASNDVVLEFGNEHWNFGGPFHEFPSEIVAKNLGRYMPTGKDPLWILPDQRRQYRDGWHQRPLLHDKSRPCL